MKIVLNINKDQEVPSLGELVRIVGGMKSFRRMFTLTNQAWLSGKGDLAIRQFRCWNGIFASSQRGYFDSCGENLVFTVWGTMTELEPAIHEFTAFRRHENGQIYHRDMNMWSSPFGTMWTA